MKDIIAIWHKAWPDSGAFVRASAQDLERFAELVRAYERDKWMERTATLIRGEREACAKLCEDGEFMTFGCAAAAMRARGAADAQAQ